jgi:hypothetical protein
MLTSVLHLGRLGSRKTAVRMKEAPARILTSVFLDF